MTPVSAALAIFFVTIVIAPLAWSIYQDIKIGQPDMRGTRQKT